MISKCGEKSFETKTFGENNRANLGVYRRGGGSDATFTPGESCANNSQAYIRSRPGHSQTSNKSRKRVPVDKTIEQLTTYASKLTYECLTANAIHSVKRSVVDSVGCALGA